MQLLVILTVPREVPGRQPQAQVRPGPGAGLQGARHGAQESGQPAAGPGEKLC